MLARMTGRKMELTWVSEGDSLAIRADSRFATLQVNAGADDRQKDGIDLGVRRRFLSDPRRQRLRPGYVTGLCQDESCVAQFVSVDGGLQRGIAVLAGNCRIAKQHFA